MTFTLTRSRTKTVDETPPVPVVPRMARFVYQRGVVFEYDRNDPAGIEAARSMFADFERQRVMIFMAADGSTTASMVPRHALTREFDPDAAEYVIERPYAGG